MHHQAKCMCSPQLSNRLYQKKKKYPDRITTNNYHIAKYTRKVKLTWMASVSVVVVIPRNFAISAKSAKRNNVLILHRKGKNVKHPVYRNIGQHCILSHYLASYKVRVTPVLPYISP